MWLFFLLFLFSMGFPGKIKVNDKIIYSKGYFLNLDNMYDVTTLFIIKYELDWYQTHPEEYLVKIVSMTRVSDMRHNVH